MMNHRNAMNLLFSALVLVCFSLGCGGGTQSAEYGSEDGTPETTTEETSNEATPVATGEVVELSIEGNDQMQYNKDMLEVPAGATVKLTLTHGGELPVEAMGHNWVLLKQGVSLEDFAMAAISSADNGYIPPAQEDNVIAHTQMLGGGDSDTIEFQAPGPGEYEFLCSFPGHYGMMRGKFVVGSGS